MDRLGSGETVTLPYGKLMERLLVMKYPDTDQGRVYGMFTN